MKKIKTWIERLKQLSVSDLESDSDPLVLDVFKQWIVDMFKYLFLFACTLLCVHLWMNGHWYWAIPGATLVRWLILDFMSSVKEVVKG